MRIILLDGQQKGNSEEIGTYSVVSTAESASNSECLASPEVDARSRPKPTLRSASRLIIGEVSSACEDLGTNNVIVSIDILSCIT